MMTRQLLAVGLLGAFFLLTGVTLGQDKAKMPETAWYPLTVGNKWTFKTQDGGKDKLKVEYVVTAIEEFNGATCARVELKIDGKTQTFEHISVTADGVYRQGFQGNKADKPVQLLKLPVKAGDSWTVESKSEKGEVLKGKFKTSEKEEKVGEKTYKTLVVASEDMDANGLKFSTTYSFAENIGIVKQIIIVGEATKQETVLELDKFESAKKEAPAPVEEKKDDKKDSKDK